MAEGARVIITGRNQTTLEAAAKELGPNALAVAADATDIAATEAAIKKGVDKFGKLDIVFANAGIPGQTPVGGTTLAFAVGGIVSVVTAAFGVFRLTPPDKPATQRLRIAVAASSTWRSSIPR